MGTDRTTRMTDSLSLTAARTYEEIVKAASRWWWWNEHGKHQSEDMVLTPDAMKSVLHADKEQRQVPADASAPYQEELLGALIDPDEIWKWSWDVDQHADEIVLVGTLAGIGRPGAVVAPQARVMVSVVVFHACWFSMPERPRHLLVDLSGSCLRRLRRWHTEMHTNLPGPVAKTRHATTEDEPQDRQMPLPFDVGTDVPVPPDEPRFVVGYLPYLVPDPSLLPLALLDLFGRTSVRGKGGPVPVAARIGWEVILAVSAKERSDGLHVLECTLMDLYRMIYPNTPKWQKVKGKKLLGGLVALDAARVRWRGDAAGGLYPLAEVYRLPTVAHASERVVFMTHLPPKSQQGPLVDCILMRELRSTSWRKHRMMIAAYCLFDRYGTVKGRLISPTLPVVHRDEAGYVLDARGKVVTEKGAPTRRPTHRKAVQTGERERNPEADRYPMLEGRDLILLGHATVASSAAGRRDQRTLMMDTAKELRRREALDFDAVYRNGRYGKRELVGLRLLPSRNHVMAHAARWASNMHNRRAG